MSIPTTSFHAKSDDELRSRVKLLGKLVGNVLLKHESAEVFHAVESRKHTATKRHGTESRNAGACW